MKNIKNTDKKDYFWAVTDKITGGIAFYFDEQRGSYTMGIFMDRQSARNFKKYYEHSVTNFQIIKVKLFHEAGGKK